jgi:acetyl-CoA carboxylase biotin carboxyl carrier protein
MEVNIESPLSGTIKEVLVKEGDTVRDGETMLILESMKMEIPVDSTAAGSVNKITVAPGGFVKQGDVLAVVLS